MVSTIGRILMQTNTTQETLVQNLKTAGCSAELIARFMSCREAGRTQDSLRVLALHRATLLDEMHANQSKLDCLDYLIRQIRTGADNK